MIKIELLSEKNFCIESLDSYNRKRNNIFETEHYIFNYSENSKAEQDIFDIAAEQLLRTDKSRPETF